MPRPPRESLTPPFRIGWKEFVDLPELGLRRLKGKIDTGARTSTLHVRAVVYLEDLAEGADGGRAAEITLAPDRRDPSLLVTARVQVLRQVEVRDSGGHLELRPLIATELVLGPVRKRIFVTLSDRSGMLFRMILGRKAVEGDFVVDPACKYLLRSWHRRRAESPRR
ncbi:MAG TPA: RimK/LysX family protein [Thermoanaerobaculia bacterium]|nr:RimK/LysX family protein [Thermoanaerobaculia bacterium]